MFIEQAAAAPSNSVRSDMWFCDRAALASSRALAHATPLEFKKNREARAL